MSFRCDMGVDYIAIVFWSFLNLACAQERFDVVARSLLHHEGARVDSRKPRRKCWLQTGSYIIVPTFIFSRETIQS